MRLRTVLAGLALLWLVFLIVGAVFHILRLLLYVAVLATAAAVIAAFVSRHARRH